jgi:hypothetical protein
MLMNPQSNHFGRQGGGRFPQAFIPHPVNEICPILWFFFGYVGMLIRRRIRRPMNLKAPKAEVLWQPDGAHDVEVATSEPRT